MNEVLKELYEGLELESEVWKVIPGFSRYQIDVNSGRIFDTYREKLIVANPNAIGYVYADVENDEGEREIHPVHRLVMIAMIEKEMKFLKGLNLEIDHRNKIRHDNRASNLCLVTKKQNHQNVSRVKGIRRLTKEEVLELRESFERDNPKQKIEWYKVKAEELGLGCWQTVQYNILNYSNAEVTIND